MMLAYPDPPPAGPAVATEASGGELAAELAERDAKQLGRLGLAVALRQRGRGHDVILPQCFRRGPPARRGASPWG